MERCSSFGATTKIWWSVEGWTPVFVRDRVLRESWASERKRYEDNPSAVTFGVFSKMSSVRGGKGGR